jgi:hypothetical protein
MAWTAVKTFTATILSVTDMNTYLSDNTDYLKKHIALEAASALTISGGVITVTQAHHKIAGESAAADDLDTIGGGADGIVLLLRPNGNIITLKNGTGNLILGHDVILATDNDYAMLVSDGTNWHPVLPPAYIQMVNGALAESGQNGKVFSWQNTLGKSVIVTACYIEITTGATAAAKLNAGNAATEIASDTMIDGAALDSVGVRNHIKPAGTNGLGAVIVPGGEWFTGFEDNSADPADLVGNYYILYTVVL